MSDTPSRPVVQVRLRYFLLLPVVIAAYGYLLRAYFENSERFYQPHLNIPLAAALVLIHSAMLLVGILLAGAWATGSLKKIEPGHLLVLRELVLSGLFLVLNWWPFSFFDWIFETPAYVNLLSAGLLIAYVVADHRSRSGPAWWPTMICMIGAIDLVKSHNGLKEGYNLWGIVESRDLNLPLYYVEGCESDIRQAYWVWTSLAFIAFAVTADWRARIERGWLHWCGIALFCLGWIAYLIWRLAKSISYATSLGTIDFAYYWWF